MILPALLLENKDDYLFNLLSIDNFNNKNSKMRFWFNHAEEFHESIKGDIFEFGVYRGGSLLAMSLLLKRIGSTKKIYAFDTFSGFPNYSKFDDISMFDSLYDSGSISKKHYMKHKTLLNLKEYIESANVNVKSISTSDDFSDNSLEILENKINALELDNIEIIKGEFKDTVPDFFKNNNTSVFSANIDCDLYDGYKVVLPHVWKALSKNGYIHLDEYYSLKFPGARIACNEFFTENDIQPAKNEKEPNEFERWFLTK
jgi:hypothetical protein